MSATDVTESKDAPVVIEGEAEDVTEATDEVENSEITETLEDKAHDETSNAESIEDIADESETLDADIVEPVAVVTTPEPEQRSSAMPLVFGGLVAGAIGFGASHFGLLEGRQTAVSDTSAISTRIEELSSEIGTLSGSYSDLSSELANVTPVDTAPLTEQINGLAAGLAAIQNARIETPELPADVIARLEALETDIANGMTGLEERMTGLEDRLADMQMAQEQAAENPAGDLAEDQLAAFQSELETLTAEATAQVEEARARASTFEKEAAEAAALAERQSAIVALTLAVESGSPFAEELSVLAEPPKALTATAENGVPSLSALQRDFPDAARAALATATVVPENASAGERLTAFLKRQTNARSLAPKEGDSTDAVLSRAEASVAQGDIEGSLAELSSLPDEAKEVLGPWVANAQARLDALVALSELTNVEN